MELKGKIVNFLGDSITEGVGVSDIENSRYDNVLKRTYGIAETNNYGIGGTRLAHQMKPSENPRYDLCFCGRAYNLKKGADLIVVYGGVNDYIHGDAPIGSWGDKTPETFYGGVYFLMNFLLENYPESKVVFMTPARCVCRGISDLVPSTRPMKKADAMPLKNYVDIIEKTANHFGIPVLNLYDKLGIDPNNEKDRVELTADGLHFNDKGHAIIAERLGDFISAL